MTNSSPPENLLKCLSLTQPWASLVILGQKTNETRSWSTSYRGLLGIHAAKTFPKAARALCYKEPFISTLMSARFWNAVALPLGALLGTVQLVDIRPVEKVRSAITSEEYAFGDYSDGRFAWLFEDPKPLPAPIKMKGALQLWSTEYRLSEQEIAG